MNVQNRDPTLRLVKTNFSSIAKITDRKLFSLWNVELREGIVCFELISRLHVGFLWHDQFCCQWFSLYLQQFYTLFLGYEISTVRLMQKLTKQFLFPFATSFQCSPVQCSCSGLLMHWNWEISCLPWHWPWGPKVIFDLQHALVMSWSTKNLR